MESHKESIDEIIREGHYVGGHSNGHLLYAPWEEREVSLVTRDSLIADAKSNLKELERFGVKKESALWFVPPYEWYNRESVSALRSLGLKVLNYTPSTATPADYTTPNMQNYKSSQQLIDALLDYEKREGLNGAIILIHPGTEKSRIDKLYLRLGEIIDHLISLGYWFERL